MAGFYAYFRSYRPIAGVAIGWFVLGTLFCKLDGLAGHGCGALDKTVWAAIIEVLRTVIMLADWQAVAAHLCEDSRCLQHLLQIGASIWPLLCAMSS